MTDRYLDICYRFITAYYSHAGISKLYGPTSNTGCWNACGVLLSWQTAKRFC